MKSAEYTVSLSELKDFVKTLDKIINGKNVFLNGELGAGKTTLVKAFAEIKNCDDASSPTFTLMQVYEGDETVYHFDLYRLKNIAELENIGFFETVEEEGTKFIEWAELFNLKDELENCVQIDIKHTDKDNRTYLVTELE